MRLFTNSGNWSVGMRLFTNSGNETVHKSGNGSLEMRLFTNSGKGSLGMRLFTSLGINGHEVHEPEHCGPIPILT